MTRDLHIDLLRSIGLMLIIIAHSKAPNLINEIRSFDVPLMLFISGLVYSDKTIKGYKLFYTHRLQRLVLPVWGFISLFLISLYTMQYLLHSGHVKSIELYIGTLLMLDPEYSIGYTWIIRVFLLIMLITPILINLNKRLQRITSFLLSLFFLIVALSISLHISKSIDSYYIKASYDMIFPYLFAYSIPFLMGLHLRNASSKELMVFSALALISIILLLVLTPSFNISSYKFPPHPVFITYGVSASIIIWQLRGIWGRLLQSKMSQPLIFTGQNTIWIYLWHIPFVYFLYGIEFSWLKNDVFDLHWIIRVLIAFGLSYTIMKIQYYLANRYLKKDVRCYFIG